MTMKTLLTSALAIAASLSLAGAAAAQASGGPDAKGNAPLKHAHTVNDGAAKQGANSFTQKQAMEHIEKSGFTSVTNLAKGDDGVWRGQAMRNGSTVDVAMDFKGNVSTPAASATTSSTTREAAPSRSATRTTSTTSSTGDATGTADGSAATTATSTHQAAVHHKARHHHHHVSCANPSPNGAACSGVDRNRNGVSDKEDRAVAAGAHP